MHIGLCEEGPTFARKPCTLTHPTFKSTAKDRKKYVHASKEDNEINYGQTTQQLHFSHFYFYRVYNAKQHDFHSLSSYEQKQQRKKLINNGHNPSANDNSKMLLKVASPQKHKSGPNSGIQQTQSQQPIRIFPMLC